MHRLALMLAAALPLLAACAATRDASPTAIAADADASAAFAALADRHARTLLAFAPEQASELGVGEDMAGAGFSSRLGSYSPEAWVRARALNATFIADLAAVDRAGLSPQDQVSLDVFVNAANLAAARNALGAGGAAIIGAAIPHTDDTWALTPYLVTQLSGPHLSLPRLLQNKHKIASPQDAEAYVARLGEMGRAIDEVAATLAADGAAGVAPPRFALEAARAGLAEFLAPAPQDNPLVATLAQKAGAIEGADADELAARAAALVEGSIYPAWRRLDATLARLAERAVDEPGVWRLGAKGEAWYRMALEAYGASGRSAAQVHDLGLSEVARITSEMDALLRNVGLTEGSVAERMAALGERADQLYPDTEDGKAALLADLRTQVADVMAAAPAWFGAVPTQSVEVRRIPAHEQDGSPGGYYSPGSVDGSRPGIYFINLKSTRDNPKLSLKTLTYHEAAPGHHFQFAYQRQVGAPPLLRNALSYSEYEEGWALYAEALAKEMGMYDGDPAGDLGRLQAELFRAARLVVDTGLHDKRWSREQAIDYMVEATGQTRASMTREVERYAVIPGQACSYKLGMIRIGELRREAEAALGDRFDIRGFHDAVLSTGAAPMPVLEAAVARWIEEQKS